MIVRLPHTWRVFVGARFGRLAYSLGGSRRHIVERNIALCFPALSTAAQQKLVQDVFVSGGVSLVETAICWLGKGETFADRSTIEGLSHLRSAEARGKGVILLGMHMSTLDLVGYVMSREVTLDVMYRRNKNPFLERIMTDGRKQLFPDAIERGDIRSVIRNLKAGHIVWYGPDQDYGPRNSVFAPFFGVSAATTTAPSRIAKITGAAVVPFTHYRYDNNSRYRVVIFPEMASFPSASLEEDAARINRFIERSVGESPDQYWWFHRRFKTRPAGEPDVYD